jgi:hypothetical protein
VLARIPDVSVESARAGEAQEPAGNFAPKPPIGKRSYRVDPPATPRPLAAMKASAREESNVPRAASASASNELPVAKRLPLWVRRSKDSSPAQSAAPPVRAGQPQDFTRSLVRFLVLVALFTAAGLSIRLMKSPPSQPTTPTDTTSVSDPSALVPATASGPQQATGFTHVDQGVRTVSENVALTADQSPPMARLIGNVQEVPARQAQHDHDEPNIH